MCSLNRCVAEQSRSVSPRRTLVSPLAGGYGSAASAVLRKQYHSDLKSKIGLKAMKCGEVLQIAMDVAGEEQSRLQKLDKLSDEGMTAPTKVKLANLLVDEWDFRLEIEDEKLDPQITNSQVSSTVCPARYRFLQH